MDSSDQNAQRTEGSVGSGESTGASHVPRAPSPPPEPEHRDQGQGRRSRSRDYRELRQLGAVDFFGTTDPAEAEAWLKRTERIFTQMRCTQADQYDFAVSLLQGDAYEWWETVPGSMLRPPTLTYEDFLREFRDKYMPEIYRDEKQREFLNLRQRSMTVAEYEVRFTQLSHYAPMMVSTDRDRCRRFEEGLHYDIRSRINLSDLRSYQDLRAAAIRAERLVKEQERYLAARKSRRSASSQGGEASGRSGKKQKYSASAKSQAKGSHQQLSAGRGESRGQGASTQTPQLCEQCGRPHSGVCRAGSGACYLCGE